MNELIYVTTINYKIITKTPLVLTRARFLDDSTVTRDVPDLVLHPNVVPGSAIYLLRRGRGYASGRGDADDGTVLSILLPRFQDGWTIRRDDLQDDHGRPHQIRLHLPRLRHGILSR